MESEDKRPLAEKVKDVKWGGKTLRSVTLFDQFKASELEELYSIGTIKVVKAGAHAIIEGALDRGLYILLSGQVSVYKTDQETGKLHRLTLLQAGAPIGELSLFDDSPRSATVTSEVNCYLFHLEADRFNQFLDRKGDNLKTRFYHQCAIELVERFRIQNKDYISSQILLWKHALQREGEE